MNIHLPYKQTFSENNCFLCGKNILEEYSVEHIFPKWLQKDFLLWDQTIMLLNGSSIPYRNLTVPCCQDCNSKYLSKVEHIIQQGVREGFGKFITIDESIIFQWVGKIFYSLLYKELTLLHDRSNPAQGTINNEKYMENFSGLHGLLQSARFPTKFNFNYPWSIFVFNVEHFGEERVFDYGDDTDRGSIKIRMGNIGIVACLIDFGSVKNATKEWFSCLRGKRIHPFQFEEIAAIVFYLNILFDRNPKFVNIVDTSDEDPQLSVIPLPLGGYSTKPIFRKWNTDDYAITYADFLRKFGFSYDDLVKSDYICSFTFSPDGSYIPMKENF